MVPMQEIDMWVHDRGESWWTDTNLHNCMIGPIRLTALPEREWRGSSGKLYLSWRTHHLRLRGRCEQLSLIDA